MGKNITFCSKKKYYDDKDMEEWDNQKFSGIGIKKMKAYKCNLSLNELNKKRQNFWNKRINPKEENWINWKIIHQAILYDEPRTELLLKEYDFQPKNGCINHLIDKNGNIYKIPNYCINDPYFERILPENKNKENINIKVRFYKYGENPPLLLDVNNNLTGKELKKEYKSYSKLGKKKKIRLFVCGIEIKDNDYLYQHNLNEEKPIFVIIK